MKRRWVRVVSSGPESFRPAGAGSFLAWLAKLADAALVDLHRRGAAVERGGGAAPGELDTRAEREAARPPPSPSVEARAAEFRELAGRTLNEREPAVWTWVAVQGFSSEEAALGLSTTAAAVRSLLRRSRERLRDALGEDGG